MSGFAKKIVVVGAISFALVVAWVIFDIYIDILVAYNLDPPLYIAFGICAFVCLLYFVGLFRLLKSESTWANAFVVILAIVGNIALIATLVAGGWFILGFA